MTNKVDFKIRADIEDPHVSQNNIQKCNNSKYWSIIGGGVLVGTITALAIGLIFGPLAAVIGFCLTAIGSAVLAAYIAEQCKDTFYAPQITVGSLLLEVSEDANNGVVQELLRSDEQPEVSQERLDRKLDEIRKIQSSTY